MWSNKQYDSATMIVLTILVLLTLAAWYQREHQKLPDTPTVASIV